MAGVVAGGLERLDRLFEFAGPLIAEGELVLERHVARLASGTGGIDFQLDLVRLGRHSLGQFGGFLRLLLLGAAVGDFDLLMRSLELNFFEPLANVEVAAARDGYGLRQNLFRLAEAVLRREELGELEVVFDFCRLGLDLLQEGRFTRGARGGRHGVGRNVLAAAGHARSHGHFQFGDVGFAGAEELFVVAAFLDRLLHAQLRDSLRGFLIARLGLLDASPTSDRLIELAQSRQRLGRAPIDDGILDVDVERPAQQEDFGLAGADLLAGVGELDQRVSIPGIDLERVAGGLKRLVPLALARRFDQRVAAALDLQSGQPSATFVVVVLVRQVGEKVLQVDQVARVVNHALRVKIVGVVVFALFEAALGVVEGGLQALPHGRGWRRQDGGELFGRQLGRHRR